MRQRRCKKEESIFLTGKEAEITIDLVLQARAKMSENKVNGPEDAVVSELIKQLLPVKIDIITKCFQERFVSQMQALSSWKSVKIFFSKTRCGTNERNQKLQSQSADVGDVEVVCGVSSSSSRKSRGT